MDCQLSNSPLPGIWVIETLAKSNQVDVSILLDLLGKCPQIVDNIGENARELVFLRILESFLLHDTQPDSTSSVSSPKIAFYRSESCEDVLRRILLETSVVSNLNPAAGPEMWKFDVQPFIEHKRATLPTHALQQLKNAILTRNHSSLVSLKEKSGLPVTNKPEHGPQPDVDNRNDNTTKVEASGTNTRICERNDRLISRALSNGSDLFSSDSCSKKLLSVNGKENASTNSTRKHVISKNGNKIRIKFIKTYKNDIICSNSGEIDGKLLSTGVNERMSAAISQQSEGNISECISLKEPVGPDEIVRFEKQFPRFDTKLPNDKSVEKHGQENEILKARYRKEGDKFEPSIRSNAPDFSATDLEDLNLLADLCSRLVQSSEVPRCSDGNYESSEGRLRHKKYTPHHDTKIPGGQDHEGPNACDDELNKNNGYMNEFPKKLQRESPNLGEAEKNDDIYTDSDGYCNERARDAGADELQANNGHMNEFPQVVQTNRPNLGEAEEDDDISTDGDVFCDKQIDIDTKKNAFLSSRCKNSPTIDWKELNVCVKCNKGGKLLVCSIKSCFVTIHESCLGSDATGEEFYCPFCAYSRAISTYTEIKKKTSSARKELTSFVCWGTRKESKKRHHGSSRINQLDLDEDDGLCKSDELKKAIAKAIDIHQVREKRNGGESHGEDRPVKRVFHSPQTDPPREYKCSPRSESADDQEMSENNENSGASEGFVRVQKQKSRYSSLLPQLRRKRVPWTSAEEEKLKEGMRRFYSCNNKFIPWKKIHEFGAAVFHDSRSTIDLKDKWRNLCKTSPKS